jgi:hypothetical protein
MEDNKVVGKRTNAVSRRTMLKTATAAAVAATLGSAENAAAAAGPIYYGKQAGQTPLNATNIFPLLAGWLLLTTNGPAETVDKTTLSRVANIDPRSADVILSKYTDAQYQASFAKVRTAFGELAVLFATALPYSGGQCPEKALTIAPVASLPCTKSAQKHPK